MVCDFCPFLEDAPTSFGPLSPKLKNKKKNRKTTKTKNVSRGFGPRGSKKGHFDLFLTLFRFFGTPAAEQALFQKFSGFRA